MNCINRTKQPGGKIPPQSDLREGVSARANHPKNNGNNKETFTFAAWNIRTLQDSDTSNRPERRTAIIAQELDRLNADIVALSETRLIDEGSLVDGNYTFFWKGLPNGSPKIHGVGFAVRTSLMHRLTELPHGISERLMTLKYQLQDKSFLHIISAYAPTLSAEQQTKEAFYEQLENILIHIPKSHRVILMGDFNARIGRNAEIWPGVIGTHGIGNINSNGEFLMTKCVEHNLTITNTQFRQRNKYKGTWQHPRSGHWHMIDYVIVKKKHLKEVKITKAITNVECWTDHRIIISKMSAILKPSYRKKKQTKTKKRINIERLQSQAIADQLRQDVESRLTDPATNDLDDVETLWANIRDSLYQTSVSVIGVTENKKQEDWFTENLHQIQPILDEKHNAFQSMQNNPNNVNLKKKYDDVKQSVCKRIRQIKNQWWTNKAKEIQDYADQHDQKRFFDAVKKIYGPTQRKVCPIKDNNGNLIKDKNLLKERWKDHYSTILNQFSATDDRAISLLPQYDLAMPLDNEITLEEIKKAINDLKNNKASGVDQIPAEVYKALVNQSRVIENLRSFFNLIWAKGEVPQDFRDAFIVNIFKNKGSAADCGNYRGISLLSIGGKILTKIMASRLTKHADLILPETQNAFRPNRGTTDLIFTLRQLQEKSKEQQSRLYMAFIDLAKAFDSINREALWKILARFGVPPKFLNVCRSLHENNWSRVLIDGEPTDPFLSQTGVRQGCVLAPTLFNLFVTALALKVDTRLHERGIAIKYRFDGGLFNLKRLRAKTRSRYISDLQYADDCGLVAESPEQLQAILETYTWAYDALGLKININKTKTMSTPPVREQPPIRIRGEALKTVEHFNYLDSIVNSNGNINKEIQHRIKNATSFFWRLRSRVFDNHDLSISTKVAVYRAIVIPSLTYSCETWVPYSRHIKDLDRLQQRQLRQIMHVKWFHKISNAEILQRAQCKSISVIIGQSRLRWAGHVARMTENRLPKCVLYGELERGRRKQGQLKRYKDVLHSDLKALNIKNNWEEIAQNRTAWRRTVTLFNDNKPDRPRRNLSEENYQCADYGRNISSRIGLFSQMRSHRRQ